MPVRRGLATRASDDYRETIPAVADAGFDVVELALEGPHRPPEAHAEAGELNALATAEGVDVVVSLPRGVDVASPHPEVRRTARRLQEDAIETARAIGAEKAVLRPPRLELLGAYDRQRRREELVEAILDLDSYADHAGVELCVANRPGGLLGVDGGLPELFEAGVSVCLDAGLARVEGFDAADQAALLVERSEAISHLHLTDAGPRGRTTPFGSGEIDGSRLLGPAGGAWSGTATVVDWEGRLAAREAAHRVETAMDASPVGTPP